jgi:hypothetical protein
MSDISQGPGWWLASDGKWYPPETWTGPPPVVTAPPNPSEHPQFPADPTGPAGQAPYGAPQYGAPQYGAPPYGVPYGMPPKTNGLAIASLVCSLVVIFGVGCVLGIIFGFVAKSQIRQSNGTQKGNGLATAGIIIGFVAIGLFILFVIIAAATGGFHACTSAGTTFNNACSNS